MLLSPIPGPRPAAPQRTETATGKNTWQSDADPPDREILIEHIHQLFRKKRPNFPPEWAFKFPDFVRRLEEALYRNAPSKAAYVDVSTLEVRLQEVAKKMHVPKSGARAQSGSQTPGTPGHSSSSSGAAQANGLFSSASNTAQSSLMKAPNGVGPDGKTLPAGNHILNGVSDRGLAHQGMNGVPMGFGGQARMSGPAGVPVPMAGAGGPGPANTSQHNGLLSPQASQSGAFPPNGSSDLQQQHARELAQLNLQHSAQSEKLAAQQLQQQAALRMAAAQHGGPPGPANGAPQLHAESSMGSPPTPGGRLPGTPQQGMPGGGMPVGGDGRPTMDLQMRQKQYQKQQRWLLLLRHVSKCTAPEGTCTAVAHCHQAKQLWAHILQCQDVDCKFDSRCMPSKTLVKHNTSCRDQRCPVCQPVREILHQQKQVLMEAAARQAEEELQGGAKRQRIEGPPGGSVSANPLTKLEECASQGYPAKMEGGVKPEPGGMKFEPGSTGVTGRAPVSKQEFAGGVKSEAPGGYSHGGVAVDAGAEQGGKMVVVDPNRGNVHGGVVPHAHPDGAGGSQAKGGKPKVQGTSLTELFTSIEIKQHIRSLRSWIYQQPPPQKGKGQQSLIPRVDPNHLPEDACQLCGLVRLSFEPPPLYCTPCGARIKRNGVYHFVMAGTDTKHVVCTQCFADQRGDTVDIEGHQFPKAKLEKKKNDEEVEEAWVQCDRCNKWNHQICALFNGRRNESVDTEYTCPECLLGGLVEGSRAPLPPSAVLMAKDLPKTHLSNFLEERLQRRLLQERTERAAQQGKRVDQVQSADGLVVRVVSSVDKKLEVKSKFAELFQNENYASEFPYKSKVVLLFQKIEGVEILLFGMYTQEFGTDADKPNTRRMYLSYLDSVKYFRPEVRTVSGEALRTFVYHEILIGYLEYTKLRGFNSVYIWACPPLKGEDYILYCHPEIQKTPKSDKLREWYLSMLRKASREGIVVETTNMFDMFFVKGDEARVPVTAARLPYFDGDYWPGAAEDMIQQMEAEVEEAIRNRGKTVKKKGKAAVKGKGKVPLMMELPTNATRDQMLMQKLGEAIGPMKEDFIMVHMHPTCSHCRDFIMFGNRWSCRGKGCDFRLCDACHAAENARPMEQRHPLGEPDKHTFFAQPVAGVPTDTRDPDTDMESEFFDTRQAFLSLCQGNHYQYDTLRRAKHSSMMVLYHLHNPSAPAFVSSCNVCQKDIEAGRGFRCEVCPDFDICSNCMELGHKHPHPMTAHPTPEERSGQNLFAREQRMVALRKWMDLLLHASDCKAPLRSCSYPKCLTIRLLFRHGMQCEKKAPGGCAHCRRMWMLLKMHSRLCKQNPCPVPRCKDLKEHWQLMQRQSETRRRYNYKEMMRQRQEEDS